MTDNITLPGQGVKLETADQGSGVQRQVVRAVASALNITVSANFNRPADTNAYALADAVANSVTAGSVTPMEFTVARANDLFALIKRAMLKKSNVSPTNAQFRLHLFQNLPTVAGGDNAAFSTNVAGYLGAIDIDLSGGLVCTDGVANYGKPNIGTDILARPASGTQKIYGLLEARAAYAPANAETFTVTLEVEQR